jgi:hypothetical protein
VEKALKFERQMKWGMIAVTVFCAALFLLDFRSARQNELDWCDVAVYICVFNFLMYRAGTLVIKELKRENESLKSGGSADTSDPTPPEDDQ